MPVVPSITLFSSSGKQNTALLRTPRIPPIDPNSLSKINFYEEDFIVQEESPVPNHYKPSLLKLPPKQDEEPNNLSSFKG